MARFEVACHFSPDDEDSTPQGIQSVVSVLPRDDMLLQASWVQEQDILVGDAVQHAMDTCVLAMLRGSGILQLFAVFDVAIAVVLSHVRRDCHCHARDGRLYSTRGIRILLVQPLRVAAASFCVHNERKCFLLSFEKCTMLNVWLQCLLVVIFLHCILHILFRTRDPDGYFHRAEPEFHASSSTRSLSAERRELSIGCNSFIGITVHCVQTTLSEGGENIRGRKQHKKV
mmetsp:Transcript_15568/g.35884  ORF Transcript_15568/g.35884 Transcript_15568/m.35884 type:complete len:229 (+) Transcript_15568:420-1106(+)